MRNLTSDAIDVSLEEVTSTRFGEFMNRVALPAMVGVFKVRPWDSFGLITIDSGLIYAVVDALLGGRSGHPPTLIDFRQSCIQSRSRAAVQPRSRGREALFGRDSPPDPIRSNKAENGVKKA